MKQTREELHKTYGGVIYLSDFQTNGKGSNVKKGSAIASRILSDRRFDETCEKNRLRKLEEETFIAESNKIYAD